MSAWQQHVGRKRAAHVDLVEGHAEGNGVLLLDAGAGLVLLLEVVLEDIVLLLGQARLDVCRRTGGPGVVLLLLRVGRGHGGRAAGSKREGRSGPRCLQTGGQRNVCVVVSQESWGAEASKMQATGNA